MLNPFIDLFGDLIHLYMLCVVVWAVLSTLISFRIVNGNQQLVGQVMFTLNRICNPVLKYIRKYLPNMGTLDLSPIVLLLLLNFARNVLYHYFYNL